MNKEKIITSDHPEYETFLTNLKIAIECRLDKDCTQEDKEDADKVIKSYTEILK